MSNWSIRDDGDKLTIVCDGWRLAFLEKESKRFGLNFPLDDEDSREAERLLLRALVAQT